MNIRLKSKSLIDLTPADSFRSYRSPSARRRANYSVFVYRWHSALYLYYRRICRDFDTGLPPTQASERRSRVSQQIPVRRPAPFPTWWTRTRELDQPDWDHAYTASSNPWQLNQSKWPIVNNAKQCIPMSSQVSNLFLPKLPCTRIQSVIEMKFVSCMCLFFLPLVPGPADAPSGTSPSQRGICNVCRQEFNCPYRSPKESASL